MTLQDDAAARNFVHTVDVLTASALAEHERSSVPRKRSLPHALRHGYGAWITAAASVAAVVVSVYGAYEYSRWNLTVPRTTVPVAIVPNGTDTGHLERRLAQTKADAA